MADVTDGVTVETRDEPATGTGPVLHVSPHPDDETLGAGGVLGVLAAADRRVVNLACGLGRPDDQDRRGRELAEALGEWGFDDERVDPPVPLSSGDDLTAARARVADEVHDALQRHRPAIVVSPQPGDGHHGHETVGRGVHDALTRWARQHGSAPRWWQWGFWRDLTRPTLYVPFGAQVLARIDRAVAAHAGEVARNDFARLPAARGTVAAVVGWERVFGYGAHAQAPMPYADLVTEVVYLHGDWVLGTPRVLDPDDPFAPPTATLAREVLPGFPTGP